MEGVHTKHNMSTPTYEVAHLKCVKRVLLNALLWCVASTRTSPRNLITTTPSPSRTKLRCLNCTCLWLHDRRANHLLGPPVMQPKAGAVKAPELSPRGRGRRSNQISRSCTSWRDTSKHCIRSKSFYTFQMGYFICRSRHILLRMYSLHSKI